MVIFFKFTVNAVDRGGRSATIPANVRVTVIRNTNAPVFTNLPNANQINHNASTGAPPIFTVFATDPDPVSNTQQFSVFIFCVFTPDHSLLSEPKYAFKTNIKCHLKINNKY